MAFHVEDQIAIQCSPDQVWPWLNQLGTGYAGWYSHDWLDNLGRQSLQYIEPRFPNIREGSTRSGMEVIDVLEDKRVVFRVGEIATYALSLSWDAGHECTILSATLDVKGPKWLVKATLGAGHHIMQKKQFEEIKERAERPFSSACERNKSAILEQLQNAFGPERQEVLEVGAGTGQHALYFASCLNNVRWTPADLPERLPALQSWFRHAPKSKIRKPLPLDLSQPVQLPKMYNCLFSANVLHIVSEPLGLALFDLAQNALTSQGKFIIYGPFRYRGEYTSDSNQAFDKSLRARDQNSGIRDYEWVSKNMVERGFALVADEPMPANNRFLMFQKK